MAGNASKAPAERYLVENVEHDVVPDIEVGETFVRENIVGNLQTGGGVVCLLAKQSAAGIDGLSPGVHGRHLQCLAQRSRYGDLEGVVVGNAGHAPRLQIGPKWVAPFGAAWSAQGAGGQNRVRGAHRAGIAGHAPGQGDGDWGVAVITLDDMFASRADVSDRGHQIVAKLALNGKAVLVAVRCVELTKKRVLQAEPGIGALRHAQRIGERHNGLRARRFGTL